MQNDRIITFHTPKKVHESFQTARKDSLLHNLDITNLEGKIHNTEQK